MSDNSIYEELKKKIIFMDFEPGAVLREKELMEAFQVSRTPVREALIRLEMDGLVRIFSNVGTFVTEVSFKQLKDVFELRSFLMRLSGQLAAARITDEELTTFREKVEIMKDTRDPKALMQIDRELHELINRATKNETLVKILDSLRDRAVRIWSFSPAENEYWNGLAVEFEAIGAALEQRDEDQTAQLLEAHANGFLGHIRSQL